MEDSICRFTDVQPSDKGVILSGNYIGGCTDKPSMTWPVLKLAMSEITV